jgi:hypothetical protein
MHFGNYILRNLGRKSKDRFLRRGEVPFEKCILTRKNFEPPRFPMQFAFLKNEKNAIRNLRFRWTPEPVASAPHLFSERRNRIGNCSSAAGMKFAWNPAYVCT